MDKEKLKRIFTSFGLGAAFSLWILALLTEPPQMLIMLFLAVLVHEMGHCSAMLLCGIPPRGLRMLPFGMLIEAELIKVGYIREWFIYMSGPFAGLLSAAAVLVLFRGCRWATNYILLSSGLGLFNLLPLPGLDGAGALRALLCFICPSPTAPYVISRAVQGIFCLAFFAGCAALRICYGTAAYPLLLSVFFLVRFMGAHF